MNMKKYLLTVVLIGMIGSSAVYSQTESKTTSIPADDSGRDDKVDKLKIAFITTELSLTTAEAEKFWPIYNECETKIKELRKANREIQKSLEQSYDTLTNADAKKKMATLFENDTKEITLRKEYAAKFSALLGDKRALKLLSLEHEFKRELLEALKDQKHDHGHHPPHDKSNGH
jgi:hypothetical protein